MRTFTLFVEDDRYRVPTVALVTCADETSARKIAAARLAESPHHISIEVQDDDGLAFWLPAKPSTV
jgi:hypothetical protein